MGRDINQGSPGHDGIKTECGKKPPGVNEPLDLAVDGTEGTGLGLGAQDTATAAHQPPGT